MLSVKVWCLPPENEDTLKAIYGEIVAAIRAIPSLSDSEEYTILVLFPTDNMAFGAGEEILVEAEFQVPPDPESGTGPRLASTLERLMVSRYPSAYVAVKVKNFDGSTIGYDSSKEPF